MVALFVRKDGVPRLTHHVYKKGRSAESIRTAKVLLIALLRPKGFDYPLRRLYRCQHGPSQTAYCDTVGVLSRLKRSAVHVLN